ncbi:MAG: hypothetical protein JO224_00255 [Pelomonas sp.]|nr:hypothetical protein [Roseateles sp.]
MGTISKLRLVERPLRPLPGKNADKRVTIGHDAADRKREQEFLRGVEVTESEWGEWIDTVASFFER